MRRALVLAGIIAFSSSLAAQASDGPKAGTWGVEGASFSSGASLLRFSSPRSALLLGATLNYQKVETDGGGTGINSDLTAAEIRLAFRRYRHVDASLRPFFALGPIIRYSKAGDSDGWGFGGSFDVGASYFFTPHLSLGAGYELSAVVQKMEAPTVFGPPANQTVTQIRAGGVRLLGAVYF